MFLDHGGCQSGTLTFFNVNVLLFINQPKWLNRKSTVDPCLVTATGASRVAELNSTVVPVNKKRKVLWHHVIHQIKLSWFLFCKKRTISWQKVIKQCKLSSVLTRSCSNERKKSNQNVKQTWKVWHFPWGRGLGGWWFYEKKPLCEKCCDKNYSKSPAEINELVAMVGGGGASHIHCVSLWRVVNIEQQDLLCFDLNTKRYWVNANLIYVSNSFWQLFAIFSSLVIFEILNPTW